MEIIKDDNRKQILLLIESETGSIWYDNYDILGIVPFKDFGYDGFVNSIISRKYPSDKMQAVINNYLLDPSNEEAIAEFNEMQEFRTYAKEAAKEALAYIEENNL